MALVLADRAQQTGTANTTVSFTLSGAVTGYQSLAVVGNGNITYYSSYDATGNWEVGLGTYSTTGPTLTRTTILSSSNAGSAVTFSGTVNVFITLPSQNATVRVVVIADGTSITVNSDSTDLATQVNTQVAGTLTINAPTGTPSNGQKVLIRLQATNAQTFSWNAIFTGSTDLSLPLTSSSGSKYDYLGFVYNTPAAKWQMLAKNFGF
tara:strand:- start:754 stop:1377 length:624 start_codon:yes stop_codon:yes gene_type:complete